MGSSQRHGAAQELWDKVTGVDGLSRVYFVLFSILPEKHWVLCEVSCRQGRKQDSHHPNGCLFRSSDLNRGECCLPKVWAIWWQMEKKAGVFLQSLLGRRLAWREACAYRLWMLAQQYSSLVRASSVLPTLSEVPVKLQDILEEPYAS